MKISSNHVAITIGVLSLMVYANCSPLPDESNSSSTSSIQAIQPQNIVSSIIPDCIFGVKSISIVLYTRAQPNGREISTSDPNIPLRRNQPIIFLIHGFTSEANNTNYFDLASALLEKEDVNVCSVDWRDGACSTGLSLTDLVSYESAVRNVPTVGEYLAKFIVKLVREYGAVVPRLKVIGHSLGAHVAGFAGKYVKKILGNKIEMIIGLDPAFPSFESRSAANRLSRGDASYLEVFHTSRLGIHFPLGDTDVYFNGGKSQPGCILPSCSHSRSVEFLTSTIRNPPCFVATAWAVDSSNIMNPRSCNSRTCLQPGLNALAQPARGTFYVTATKNEPFCTA
ncbi:phospholipase A1-like isoform X2 [Andrena cerasifolii]|uniref:phospholipase A1-like isoform X2 n=1 Tax=Andrena cerasifolii TaxID=2819439 RepID=UPI004037856D